MSDELKRLYADEWKAAHPYPSKRDVDASERFLQALQVLESQNQVLQEALEEADRNIAAIRKAADDPAFSHEFVGKVTRSVLAGPPTETQRQILARLSLTVEADSE